ncbi:hypothetical protein QCA50_019864 [Cerrena zonata]|uniref:Uncharacterized protein n=1 Tax=Cerrena zonata TaxID=2478898 RepID=A0AAW0FKI6_9APHY
MPHLNYLSPTSRNFRWTISPSLTAVSVKGSWAIWHDCAATSAPHLDIIIGEDPALIGSLLVPIILGSDKTTVSVSIRSGV